MDPITQCQNLLRIQCIVATKDEVRLIAEAVRDEVACPQCQRPSTYVHSTYQRTPIDLPWGGYPTRLIIRARRFRCQNPDCPRRIFTEPFPGFLARYAHCTERAKEQLRQLAIAQGGEAGARAAKGVGMARSGDTLLRLIMATPCARPTPCVLGIDDVALRKGQHYATQFYDLREHQPVDLREEREATTVANWLREHPGVRIIVRDRAPAYAKGAREGAPEAIQVADRWHLLHDAGQALDELQRQRRKEGSAAFRDPAASPAALRAPPEGWPALFRGEGPVEHKTQWRLARLARWEGVREMRAEGLTLAGIAQALGVDETTVKGDLRSSLPPADRRYPQCPRKLSPFLDYLRKRWEAGCHKASQLHQEIQAQGYPGKAWTVRVALAGWRQFDEPKRPAQTKHVRWLLLRHPRQLKDEERKRLEQVLAADELLGKGHALLQRFRAVVAERDVAGLQRWLVEAKASALAPFESLANGIQDDIAAVQAGLVLPWSNGPLEGQNNKFKLIKRQGYGRAKINLLKQRELLAAS